MKKTASLLEHKNKFLIFGCGFSGSFFAKTIRKFGCTVLTTSRSASKDPNNFVFDSDNDIVPDEIFLMKLHIFLAAYLQIKMVTIQY